MKYNYLLIPFSIIVVAIAGSVVTDSGMEWYHTLRLPTWTPGGSTISMVWTVIYILTSVSMLMVWNAKGFSREKTNILRTFVLNLVLNVSWSIAFFGLNMIGLSIVIAFLLTLTVIALMAQIRSINLIAATLLAPYAFWSLFAAYLTYSIWILN